MIDIADISGCFEKVLSMYRYSDSSMGDALIDLLQADWDIFADRFFDTGNAANLLQDIMLAAWDDDSGNPFPDPSESYDRIEEPNLVETWESFLQENEPESMLMDFVTDEDLPRAEKVLPAGTILYRARIGWQTEENGVYVPWQGDKIGPNPSGPPGRANFLGAVVLYCADQERTAVSEVRPARGLLVSVCKIKLTNDIRTLDLSHPLDPPSPFTSDYLPYELSFLELLDNFSNTLSKPLERHDNPEDYLPSQKLANYIRRAGFSGIIYPSALDSLGGKNLVIFEHSGYEVLDSKLVRVTDTKIELENEVEWPA